MPDKCLLILLDGLGDRSIEAFGWQTPLQAARTPHLDRLAEEGASGLYHSGAMGQALSSENAHFLMFGFDSKDFPGRGPLEALGVGISLGPNDVAVLTHFARVHESEDRLILDRGEPTASTEEAEALFAAVSQFEVDGISIRLERTKGLSGILVMEGNVSPFITDTDPIREGSPLAALHPWREHADDPAAQRTAAALRAYLIWAHHRLKTHPVNQARQSRGMLPIEGLVTQRAGRLKAIPNFREQNGLRGLSISSGIIYWGLSAFLGLDCLRDRDTGDPAEDLARRLTKARESFDHYDFIHVHTKAPDEAGHSRDPLAKKAVIEALDEGLGRVLGPLREEPGLLLIVTADHSTPSCGTLIHSGEPVPLTICGSGVRRDGVNRFDEINAATGALGCVRGKELMYLILNYLDRAKLGGLMDTPVDQAYWPGDYEPFRLR
ncbi:alkaline phosphatase family protein [Desulfuromonas sp. TF]|uniref:alkaline phosphatase family protein n=1 Tax=Desulfuromonas sp. TF TaxID=1232410 RepID=UPI0003FA16A5|nr:alkaline phosphatase family protein [Desulfuromonas sp. TF]